MDQTTTPAADLQQKYRQFLDLLPLTVALANYISTVSGVATNPYGAIMAGAVVLAVPVVVLVVVFQRHFVSVNIGSAVKG